MPGTALALALPASTAHCTPGGRLTSSCPCGACCRGFHITASLLKGFSFLQELVLRAFTCVCKQQSPSRGLPPLFAHLEEIDPWCRPRTLQGASVAFEYNGRLQFWTVPETGVYRITARGAKAADGVHRCDPVAASRVICASPGKGFARC